jgi:hypothetical protein
MQKYILSNDGLLNPVVVKGNFSYLNLSNKSNSTDKKADNKIFIDTSSLVFLKDLYSKGISFLPPIFVNDRVAHINFLSFTDKESIVEILFLEDFENLRFRTHSFFENISSCLSHRLVNIGTASLSYCSYLAKAKDFDSEPVASLEKTVSRLLLASTTIASFLRFSEKCREESLLQIVRGLCEVLPCICTRCFTIELFEEEEEDRRCFVEKGVVLRYLLEVLLISVWKGSTHTKIHLQYGLDGVELLIEDNESIQIPDEICSAVQSLLRMQHKTYSFLPKLAKENGTNMSKKSMKFLF